MKKLFAISFAALALTACGNAVETGSSLKEATTVTVKSDSMVNVKTKAVLVYADWCGSCKVIDPTVTKVKNMGPLPGVEFVVLDSTDKDESNFYAQALGAGVEAAVRAHMNGKIKTGQLLLVDVDDAKVLNKITKEDAASVILSKIKAAVSAS